MWVEVIITIFFKIASGSENCFAVLVIGIISRHGIMGKEVKREEERREEKRREEKERKRREWWRKGTPKYNIKDTTSLCKEILWDWLVYTNKQ